MKNLILNTAKVLAIVAMCATVNAKGDTNKVEGQDSLDGCGLGWQVTQERTMSATTTRGTTNNIVPPAFGMTSGTMGCDKIPFADKNKESATFVAKNYETLKTELAEGQGEYVTAMVVSFGCNSDRTSEIAGRIQKNYSSTVASARDAAELHANLKSATACL